MGFFSGNISYSRFRIPGYRPGTFTEEFLDRLDAMAIGTQKVASKDGVSIGWVAGDHILDKSFQLEKNVIQDTLSFGLRVDVNRLPSDLLRAYAAQELAALAKGNPSGIPSKRQRKEAKEAAQDRLEAEAKDGRFLKRKMVPVLWDGNSGEVYLGSSSVAMIDRFVDQFEATFGKKPVHTTSGGVAYQLAETHGLTNGVEDAEPSAFMPGRSSGEVAWMPDEACRDFLGNEFFVWLWYKLDGSSDEITLSDGSTAAVMISKSMSLECPRGQTGKQTVQSEGPSRMPEAHRALFAGKWPRKAGFIMVRHQQQYEFNLSAETFAVGSLKLPATEESEERARLEERVNQLRAFLETLDLLFEVFVAKRAAHSTWKTDLGKMQKWLARKHAEDKAASGEGSNEE